MVRPLTIGTLARRASVGVETIRFYERRGLVRQPPRPFRGFRCYPEETVARIRFIRQAQALGFTLKEIAGLLALRVAPGADCGAVRTRAAAKLADVEARMTELESIRRALEKLLAACPGSGEVTSCTILGAISGGEPEGTSKPVSRPPRGARRKNSPVGRGNPRLEARGWRAPRGLKSTRLGARLAVTNPVGGNGEAAAFRRR